jgi:hypothetical protein
VKTFTFISGGSVADFTKPNFSQESLNFSQQPYFDDWILSMRNYFQMKKNGHFQSPHS